MSIVFKSMVPSRYGLKGKRMTASVQDLWAKWGPVGWPSPLRRYPWWMRDLTWSGRPSPSNEGRGHPLDRRRVKSGSNLPGG
jgi:hypothetical protein